MPTEANPQLAIIPGASRGLGRNTAIHLAQRGVTCPLPVRSRRGEALGVLADRPATIVTFLNGLWIRRPTARHCAQLGEALATMHRAGDGFALKRPNALSIGGWPPFGVASVRSTPASRNTK